MADEAIMAALRRVDNALRRVERSVPALVEAKRSEDAMADNLARMRAAVNQAVADIDALTAGDQGAKQWGQDHG